MKKWTTKLKLLSVLATTKELLLRSDREGWPDENPKEAAENLDRIISHLLDPNGCPLPEFATVYYAPTGPIQEIAINNGWHDTYMALANEYDKIMDLLMKDKGKKDYKVDYKVPPNSMA